MKKETSKIKSDILWRVWLLYALFVLAVGVIFVRLIYVQFVSSEIDTNAKRLASRIFTEQTIKARRGSILSRTGAPLATSLFRYQAAFDFGSPGLDSIAMFNEQSDSLAKLLSAFFKDKPAAEYSRMFRSEHARRYRLVNGRDTTYVRSEGWFSRFIDRMQGEEYITRKIYDTIRDHTPVTIFPREVDYAEWETLRKYPLLNWNMGMVYNRIEHDRRIYPQGELARRVIGLTGDQGNYGIEDAYREELTGKDGKAVLQRIARGFYTRVADAEQIEPTDGCDIITTLDVELQDVADKVLRQQLEAQNAIWGTTIVMEVKTGEILAMANLGRPNSGGAFYERENYALGRSMEPGSTFKLATMLTLLEDSQMSPETKYETHNGDPVTIGPAKNIRDSHRGDRTIALQRAVSGSSNVYFAKAIWERYGITGRKQAYSDYLNNKLHLGEPVGLERLGERSPDMAQNWNKVPDPGIKVVKMSYGYRVRMAPIQMITFYNAIANDGRMISPVLVRELRRGDKIEERIESRTIAKSICSDSTLKIVRNCLEAVCTEGTAAAYFRDTTRLRVAAKTGTAQITDSRMGGRYYLGSMVAYFPADNPRYTVLTTIETKQQPGKAYYGGPLAGPVVKRMVEYIHNRKGSEPIEHQQAKMHPRKVKGGDIAQIRRVADNFSPRASFDRRTGWGRTSVDSLSNVIITSIPAEADAMPDVRGMGLKDALFILENRGLKVNFSGQGAVVEQSLAAGERIKPGVEVTITLR